MIALVDDAEFIPVEQFIPLDVLLVCMRVIMSEYKIA